MEIAQKILNQSPKLFFYFSKVLHGNSLTNRKLHKAVLCLVFHPSQVLSSLCTLMWPQQWGKCSLLLPFSLPWPITFCMQRVCVPLHLLRLKSGYPSWWHPVQAFQHLLYRRHILLPCFWMETFCVLVTEHFVLLFVLLNLDWACQRFHRGIRKSAFRKI